MCPPPCTAAPSPVESGGPRAKAEKPVGVSNAAPRSTSGGAVKSPVATPAGPSERRAGDTPRRKRLVVQRQPIEELPTPVVAAPEDTNETARRAEVLGLATEVDSADARLTGIGQAATAGVVAGSGTRGRASAGAASGAGNQDRAGAHRGAVGSSKPRLLGSADPCHGLFPWRARSNHGEVTLSLWVDPAGHPHPERVIDEHPRGEGFAEAARACAQRLRFSAAHDERGAAIAARSVVKLDFDRH